MSTGWSTRRGLLATGAALLLFAAGLWILRQQIRPHYRLTARAAVAAARESQGDREFLAHNPTSNVRVIPLDGRLQRVTFFDGPQLVLDAAVGERGEVVATERHVAGAPASGATLANSPWILGLLSGVFLLATMVTPLRRLRNLDALALASVTITVALINARLIAVSVIVASVALFYLMIRCLSIGLRDGRAAPPPSTPLLSSLCAGWEPRRRTRLLRQLVLATMLAFAMITLTSSGYTDVAAASLEGATDLLHGVLPYGHIHLALHGDTYPLLNYLLYVPGALWLPVTNGFSDLSGSLPITALASLLVGMALYRIAGSPEIAAGKGAPNVDRQLRVMLAWFAFPPVLLAASGGSNDLLLAACLAWMLALRTRAATSMLLLAMGAWVKLVPLILVPIWIPFRRRELARACAVAVAVSGAMVGLLVALGGLGAVSAMLHSLSFQFQRGSYSTPWYTFELEWLQPLAQAAVLVTLLAAMLHLRADPSARTDPVRLSAIAAALLLGVQLAANYWTWSYLPWVFPFLAVALLMGEREDPALLARPNRRSGAFRARDLRRQREPREPALDAPGPG